MRTKLAIGRAAGTLGRIDRTIDDDGARKPLAMDRACENGDEAAKRVTDNDRRLFVLEEARILAHRHLLFGENLDRIFFAPAAFARLSARSDLDARDPPSAAGGLTINQRRMT